MIGSSMINTVGICHPVGDVVLGTSDMCRRTPPPPPLRARACRDRRPPVHRKAPALPPGAASDDEAQQNEQNEAIWVRRIDDRLSPPVISADKSPPLPDRVPLRPLTSSSPRQGSPSSNLPPRCFGCHAVEEQQQLHRQNASVMPFSLSGVRQPIQLETLSQWPFVQEHELLSSPAAGQTPPDCSHQRRDNEYVAEPSSSSAASRPLPSSVRVLPSGRTQTVVADRLCGTTTAPLPVNSRTRAIPGVKDGVSAADCVQQMTSIICKNCGGCKCRACRNANRFICTDRLCSAALTNDDDDDECLDVRTSQSCIGRTVFSMCLCSVFTTCRRRCRGSPEPCHCPV